MARQHEGVDQGVDEAVITGIWDDIIAEEIQMPVPGQEQKTDASSASSASLDDAGVWGDGPGSARLHAAPPRAGASSGCRGVPGEVLPACGKRPGP